MTIDGHEPEDEERTSSTRVAPTAGSFQMNAFLTVKS